MKISPFAYLLALGLHLSPTLAQSETSEDDAILSIPIKDVLAKNTAPYEQHQLFKTYTNWLSTSEEAKYVMENPNNPEIVTPSLVGIECYPDDAECYFSSEIDLSGVSDEDWQGLVETFEDAEDIPGKLKRQAATQRVFKFNVVTFFKGNDAKHKFRVNPKVR